jgi:hypothetical protein
MDFQAGCLRSVFFTVDILSEPGPEVNATGLEALVAACLSHLRRLSAKHGGGAALHQPTSCM